MFIPDATSQKRAVPGSRHVGHTQSAPVQTGDANRRGFRVATPRAYVFSDMYSGVCSLIRGFPRLHMCVFNGPADAKMRFLSSYTSILGDI